ncbi:MAG: hypothetical protein JNJ54_27315 [Myxococcaceae bacterium]|nr:hypothetical protein [Myxococcaceae bacterium]
MRITNQSAALRGATLVVAWASIAAVLWGLNSVVFRLLGDARPESVEGLMTLLWLGLSVLLGVGVIMIGTASDRPGFAWALVALIAVSELFSLGFTLSRIFAAGEFRWWSALSVPSSVVGLAERVVFLWFFVSLCGPRRPWALIVALIGGSLVVVRSLFFLALPFVGGTGFLGSPLYPWVLGAVGLLTMGTTLAVTLGARGAIADGSVLADGSAAPAVVAAPVEGERASPGADFAIGSVLLAVGIGVTVMSYAAASSSGGGRYLIATGFIGVGVGRLIRGLMRASKSA